MKTLLITFCVLVSAFAADKPPESPTPLKPGMTIADATKVLLAAGLASEERQYDQIIPDGVAIRYFPIQRDMALEIIYTKATGRIDSLLLMTSPQYQPVKGLEVYLPLREIAFHADGSYSAHFDAPTKPK